LSRLEVTLLGGSDIDSLDVEGTGGGCLAASWGGLSQNRGGKGEEYEGLHFQKIERTGERLNGCGGANCESSVTKGGLMNEVSVFSMDNCTANVDRTSNHDNQKCQTEETTISGR
jgi:hypothetical protein